MLTQVREGHACGPGVRDCHIARQGGNRIVVGVRRYLFWGREPEPRGLRARFAAGADIEFAEDRGDVMIDRLY